MIREVLAWIVLIVGFGISIYFIIRSLVFSYSLFKDAPYVPADKGVVKQALGLLKLKKGDNFVDIGSGTGYAVFESAKLLKGMGTFLGVEISGWLVFASDFRNMFNRYSKNIRFIKTDMFDLNYSDRNKVFLFLTSDLIERLLPKLEKELPAASMVVSVLFGFPEEFVKTHDVKVKQCKMWGKEYKLYLWRK